MELLSGRLKLGLQVVQRIVLLLVTAFFLWVSKRLQWFYTFAWPQANRGVDTFFPVGEDGLLKHTTDFTAEGPGRRCARQRGPIYRLCCPQPMASTSDDVNQQTSNQQI